MRKLSSVMTFLAGAVVGALHDCLTWTYHLPYLGFNWLEPLLRERGPRTHDARDGEYLIDFGVFALLIRLCFLLLQRRKLDH